MNTLMMYHPIAITTLLGFSSSLIAANWLGSKYQGKIMVATSALLHISKAKEILFLAYISLWLIPFFGAFFLPVSAKVGLLLLAPLGCLLAMAHFSRTAVQQQRKNLDWQSALKLAVRFFPISVGAIFIIIFGVSLLLEIFSIFLL